MSAALQDLERLVRRLDDEIAAIDREVGPQPSWAAGSASSWEERDKWWHAHDAAYAALKAKLTAEENAGFPYRAPDGHTIRMAGIRSSSTGGWSGALRNWQRAARKKLEGGR